MNGVHAQEVEWYVVQNTKQQNVIAKCHDELRAKTTECDDIRENMTTLQEEVTKLKHDRKLCNDRITIEHTQQVNLSTQHSDNVKDLERQLKKCREELAKCTKHLDTISAKEDMDIEEENPRIGILTGKLNEQSKLVEKYETQLARLTEDTTIHHKRIAELEQVNTEQL